MPAETPSERNFRITNNNAIDKHVGKRVRLRRTLLGLSQEQLGDELNITFQQVQKYERGANRVSASRLWDISQILDVPIGHFFDDMTDTTMRSSPRRVASGVDADEVAGEAVKDPMARRETLELVRVYYTIQDAGVRKHATDLVKSIAAAMSNK